MYLHILNTIYHKNIAYDRIHGWGHVTNVSVDDPNNEVKSVGMAIQVVDGIAYDIIDDEQNSIACISPGWRAAEGGRFQFQRMALF